MNPGNVAAHIHNEGYRDDYYAVDQYDTCLRARWFEEQTRDSSGRQLPLDWDFDRWPTMELPISWNTADPGLFLYEGPMVFTRTFVWESRCDERVFLRFGGAH